MNERIMLLDTDPPAAADDGDYDAVTAIVNALRAKFGDDAHQVACLQYDNASPESSEQWGEVVSRLSA